MIVINGKFLLQNITGTQRVAFELLKKMDEYYSHFNDKIVVAVPNREKIPENLCLKNILLIPIGNLKGSLWEHINLARFVQKNDAICFSFSGAFPLFVKRGVYYLHDIHPIQYKQYFSRRYSIYQKIIVNHVSKAKDIFVLTNSEHTKLNILRWFPSLKERISIVYPGWEHTKRYNLSDEVCVKWGVKKHQYYVVLATLTKHKNLEIVLKVASEEKDKIFVIIGQKPSNQVLRSLNLQVNTIDQKNIIFTNYINDEGVFSLIKYAKAVIVPSIFEGFGLPILESLSLQTPVIASKIEAFQELFSDVVTFFDPFNVSSLKEALENLKFDEDKAKNLLEKYSWERAILSLIKVYKIMREHNYF
ncbi:MAG: hypothetical protein PWQ20_1939 [Thermotogaceae bacterium]|uniref:glycosyltransferase family 4 protein n=1 Tax=Pseudothermotoga elfii TaxID=38322 RepID=UPI000407EAFF|nr:glycosyltransferase family 1 protein [Pseudothermotoga elfii]MDN5338869.1 hypothetical protein [Thermotogaceae bacterium]